MQILWLKEVLDRLQVQRGNVILFSSDIKKLAWNCMKRKEKLDLNDLLDTVIEAIGEEGTLLIPTYNWDFCKGVPFDYLHSPCMTGTLGTVALKRSDFTRSLHPLYSCAIWGRDREMLCTRDYKDSFGKDSLFAYLHEKKAKNLALDVALHQFLTFTHYVEESEGVSYRYVKDFSGEYIDGQGKSSHRTYSMYVRDLDLDVRTLIDPCEGDFLEQGAARQEVIYDSRFLLVELAKAYEIMADDIRNNNCRKLCAYIGQN